MSLPFRNLTLWFGLSAMMSRLSWFNYPGGEESAQGMVLIVGRWIWQRLYLDELFYTPRT